MLKNHYNQEIPLYCPVCGSNQFRYDDSNISEDSYVECVRCEKELKKSELIEINSESIQLHNEEFSKVILKNAQKEFEKELKKIFGNSKFFRIK